MRTRLGLSGLVALVLVVSTACVSSGATDPDAGGSTPAGVPGARASTAADTGSGTGSGTGPGTSTPFASSAKTALSGCNSAGKLEVCFSSPATHGGRDPAVVRHFIDIFKSAGAGDSLRIAMFRWDIPATTKAIVAAQQRGAHVEIVADEDMTTKKAGQQVIAQIEKGDPMANNVVVCQGACLPWAGSGPAPPSQNVNHLKYLLADIGGKKSVITSSSNFEGRQYSQVNSLTRFYDDGFYAFGLQYFQRLRAQSWTVGGVTWTNKRKSYAGPPSAMVYPRKRGDLVVNTLKQVHCAKGMNTVHIMIAVVQRYDVRAQIGRLANEGCNLRIVTTRDLIENWLQSPVQAPQRPDRRHRQQPRAHDRRPRQGLRDPRQDQRQGALRRRHRHQQHHLRRSALQRRDDAPSRRQVGVQDLRHPRPGRLQARPPEPRVSHPRPGPLPLSLGLAGWGRTGAARNATGPEDHRVHRGRLQRFGSGQVAFAWTRAFSLSSTGTPEQA